MPMTPDDALAELPRGDLATAAFAQANAALRPDDVRAYLAEVFRLAPAARLDPAIVVAQSAEETSNWTSDWFRGGGAAVGDGGRYVVGTATGVFVGDDAGATWRQSRAGLEGVTVSVDPLGTPVPDEEQRRGFGISALALDPADPGHLWAGTVGGLYESNDGAARGTASSTPRRP